MFDCHIHTNFSGDSDMAPLVACEKAIESGFHGIAFTDHLDLDFPNFDISFNIDFDKYSSFMENLKLSYSGKLNVLKGIEVGLQPQIITDTKKIVNTYDFDFVIASIHIIDKLDPYSGEYFKERTKEDTFNRYLEVILSSLHDFNDFDVIGHIGYIRRYCGYSDNTLRYNDYRDILDLILKKTIELGKGLDVNTSGYRSGLGSPIPDYDILNRYRELGGEIICIGSDAHFPEHIGHSFDITIAKLKELGFKYAVHFEKRKPVFTKLP